MDRFRSLALPIYLIGTMLVLFPIIDTVATVTPFHFGEVAWRFGTIGLISRALLTPLLGLLLMMVTALLLEHRRTLRAMAGLALSIAAVLLLMMGLFGLDALQMRAQVRAELLGSFDMSSAIALIKYLVAVVMLILLGIRGWRAGSHARRSNAAEESGLLVGARRSAPVSSEPSAAPPATPPAEPADSPGIRP